MRNFINRFERNEDGTTSIEYGLIIAFIGLGLIIVAQSLGLELVSVFTDITAGLAARK